MAFYLRADHFPKASFMQRISYPEGWVHFPRIANEYILFMVKDGILFISEDNSKYELHTGDMLLLEPGRFHVGYQGSAVDYYFIHMPSDTFGFIPLEKDDEISDCFLQNKYNYFKANLSDYELYDTYKLIIPKSMHLETEGFLSVSSRMEEVIQAQKSGDEYYKLLCSRNILDIMICLSKCFSQTITARDTNPDLMSKKDLRVVEILSLLQSRYQNKIEGKDIEAHLHMNFDYLNRLFKTQIGLTIFEYLKIFRINKAKELLTNSNMKMYEIAELTGFPNEYHFSRVFTRTVGISPGKYRHIL